MQNHQEHLIATGVSENSPSLTDYCKENLLTEEEVMDCIANGTLISRVVGGKIRIFENIPSPNLSLPPLEDRNTETIENLLERAVSEIKKLSHQRNGATILAPKEDLTLSLQTEIAEKDAEIRKLKGEIEDLSMLNETLTKYLPAR